jgi:hypothetical protein
LAGKPVRLMGAFQGVTAEAGCNLDAEHRIVRG